MSLALGLEDCAPTTCFYMDAKNQNEVFMLVQQVSYLSTKSSLQPQALS